MKTTPILVPIALTLSAIIWLGNQHRTLADLEAQITRFETHLAKSHPATSSQPRLRDIKTALDGQPVNWMLVARELAHNPGGYGIFKANRRIEEHLASLTADELIAALEAADDLSEKEHKILESHLLPLLCEKDPGYLMQQALDDDAKRTRWQDYLPSALTNWTKISPIASFPTTSIKSKPPPPKSTSPSTPSLAKTTSTSPANPTAPPRNSAPGSNPKSNSPQNDEEIPPTPCPPRILHRHRPHRPHHLPLLAKPTHHQFPSHQPPKPPHPSPFVRH